MAENPMDVKLEYKKNLNEKKQQKKKTTKHDRRNPKESLRQAAVGCAKNV